MLRKTCNKTLNIRAYIYILYLLFTLFTLFLKEPTTIFSTFFETFGDFAITRNLIYFSEPIESSTATNYSFVRYL